MPRPRPENNEPAPRRRKTHHWQPPLATSDAPSSSSSRNTIYATTDSGFTPLPLPQSPVKPSQQVDAFDEGWDTGDFFSGATSIHASHHGDDSDVEMDHEAEDTPAEIFVSAPRTKYQSSVDPMAEWADVRSSYIDQYLSRHSLGHGICAECGTTDGDIYWCRQCGDFRLCTSCCLRTHKRTPLHRLERWNGRFFERTSLKVLGMVMVLNHDDNTTCSVHDQPQDLVVVDMAGIFTVSIQVCRCPERARPTYIQIFQAGWYPATAKHTKTAVSLEVLDHYRRLKVHGALPVRAFVDALEHLMDPWQVNPPDDRYRIFGRLSRQLSFIMRVVRSGVQHDGGLDAATSGALVVTCWACPRIGINMEPGWENAPQSDSYLHRPILACDANFRQTCKYRPTTIPDPPLYDGLGVQMPWDFYHDWLRTYITEVEVSHCVAFAALAQKDTRFSTGLRWAGVIGIICARHEVMLGLGDLERGERYKNTDFVLFWVLSRMSYKQAAITYDIACQYKKNFARRVADVQEFMRRQILALPAEIQALQHPALVEVDIELISWALPIWHGNVHALKCETVNSVKYRWGVGKTDGEGIERVWAILNRMAYMLKEEQPGARHDDLEDKINHHNFRKNLTLGDLLAVRLRIAIEERNNQIEAFDVLCDSMPIETRKTWEDMVEAFKRDPSSPNPYMPAEHGLVTEHRVRAELQEQERIALAAEEAEADTTAFIETSTTKSAPPGRRKRKSKGLTAMAFMILGMELEDSAVKLRGIIGRNSSADASTRVTKMRQTYQQKLKSFRHHQSILMPGVQDQLDADEAKRAAAGKMAVEPEDQPLYLPSAFGEGDGTHDTSICPVAFAKIEQELRKGRCGDAVAALRGLLVSRRHLINTRNAHHVGQIATTRSARLIESVTERIAEAAHKYETAFSGLRALVGLTGCLPFRPLDVKKDLDLLNPAETDADAIRRLNRVGGRDSRVTGSGKQSHRNNDPMRDTGEHGNTRVHWLWTADGGPNAGDEGYVHESVRNEWAKALARRDRWTEEVLLLKKEMARVFRSLYHDAEVWERRASQTPEHLDEAIAAGYRAYALKTADALGSVREKFCERWQRTAPNRASQQEDTAVAERTARAWVAAGNAGGTIIRECMLEYERAKA